VSLSLDVPFVRWPRSFPIELRLPEGDRRGHRLLRRGWGRWFKQVLQIAQLSESGLGVVPRLDVKGRAQQGELLVARVGKVVVPRSVRAKERRAFVDDALQGARA
jgi:hypothetical protein